MLADRVRMATFYVTGGIDSYTKLMLHGDGSNGGIVITDEIGKTVTRAGNVCTKTSIKKFGTASIYFDGSGDYLSLANSPDFDFDTGDFVVDCWVYPIVFTSNTPFIFATRNDNVSLNDWYFLRINDTSGHLQFYSKVGPTEKTNIITTTTLTRNAWNHVEVSKVNGIAYVFINGVLGGSGSSGDCPIGIHDFYLGAQGGKGNNFTGYIDEFRVKKGIGGHTSTFTPPTEPYST